MRNSKTIKKRDIVAYYLPLYYLLSQYTIGPVSLGTIGLGIVALTSIRIDKSLTSFRKHYRAYIYFLLYVLIRDILKAFFGFESMQTQFNKIIEYFVVFILVLIICNNPIDESKVFRAWKIVGSIFIAGIIYHSILVFLLARSVSPISIIPGYDLLDGEVGVYRPVSFFSEPAAFVTAIMPLLFLALKNNDFKWAVIVTISIFLSTSTVGIVLSIVLWASSFMIKRKEKKKRFLILCFSLLLIVGFLTLDIFSESLSKFEIVVARGGTFGSRVLTGFEVISTQTPLSLVFGTNYNTAMQYVTDHLNLFISKATYNYWLVGYVFMNSFTNLIFCYGVVGLLLFLNPLIAFLKNEKYTAKPYIMTVLVALFGQSILLNSAFFLMMTVILFSDNKIMGNRLCL